MKHRKSGHRLQMWYFCYFCRKQFSSLSFWTRPSCTYGTKSAATFPQEEWRWRPSSRVQHAPSTRSKLPYRCSANKFHSDASAILPARKSNCVPSPRLLCPRWAQINLFNCISECKTLSEEFRLIQNFFHWSSFAWFRRVMWMDLF